MQELIQEIAAIGLFALVVAIVFRLVDELADYKLSKRKNKMRYYLISYEHDTGVGRFLWALKGPLDGSAISMIEKHLGRSVDERTGRKGTQVCITSISEIDGPITLQPIMQTPDSKDKNNE